MMATIETLRINGHPYTEICNESIIEVRALNFFTFFFLGYFLPLVLLLSSSF